MMLYLFFCVLLVAVLAVLLAPALKAGPSHKRFIIAVSALFFIASFGLYFLWGSPGIIPLIGQRQEKLMELKATIAQRSDDVKADPKNLGAWVELGESFMQTDDFPAAANAFKQSVVLSQGNPILIMAYAQALIFTADGKVTDDAKKSLEMVLLQQPDNSEARYYLAVRQLQDGHTQDAMKAMKELYHSLPDNSPLKKIIDDEIGKKPN
jgi:cytochrome c-type biogenesis protein CcmH